MDHLGWSDGPSSPTNSFRYNGLGLRVQKVDSGGTVNYATDGSDVASPVLADTNATYTPGLSERRGTTSKFYHADALGSTRGITDASQSATDGILYDAFGQTVSRTGTTPTPFGFVGTGQYQTDPDSGLMLLGHRYCASRHLAGPTSCGAHRVRGRAKAALSCAGRVRGYGVRMAGAPCSFAAPTPRG